MNDPATFGGCPNCGGNDGYFNIGRAHFFFCRPCRVMGPYGENLLSTWKQESEADWALNRSEFNAYEWAEPVFERAELEKIGATVEKNQEPQKKNFDPIRK